MNEVSLNWLLLKLLEVHENAHLKGQTKPQYLHALWCSEKPYNGQAKRIGFSVVETENNDNSEKVFEVGKRICQTNYYQAANTAEQCPGCNEILSYSKGDYSF